ncbi:MAM and LDL-receptor class A domain-containing protein 1-like [Lytechinus pictus]|uniref:MAM and LDL-receptor class A domain-containing protein 1-like n=1 Tax=Lytechinus pictus TaxID=7653 RepID=UPI0030B9EB48
MNWDRCIRNRVLFLICLTPCLYHVAQSTTAPPTLLTGFQCDFEISIVDGWCGIRQEVTDNFDWIRKTSDDPSFTDPHPSGDHTYNVPHAHYLYASSSNGFMGQLNMPDFAQNTGPQCLEFFYQFGGDNSGQLNVYQWLSVTSIPSTPALQVMGNTDDVWFRGLLTIMPQTDIYTVSFVGVAGSNQKSFIAIDDVKISDGLCPMVNYSCTFESIGSVDENMCYFVQDPTDDEDWILSKGSTGSTYTGPSIDHTLKTAEGYYLYVEASYMSIGHKTRVITPTLRGVADGSPVACLTFFYHMFGTDVGGLKVYVLSLGTSLDDDTVPDWGLSGNRGDKWRGAEVDITLADDFVIIFEGVRGESYEGDMAIDDLDFTRGDQCPGQHKPPSGDQQGTCDFEEVELCLYTQNQDDDADWIWQNRASPYVNAGPLYDHTSNDEFGFYLFLYGDVGHRVTARITSPIVPLQSSHTCLQFWWYLYGLDDESLNVYCVQDGGQMGDPLISMSGDYGPYWRRSRHEIPPELTPCRLVFEGTTGIHNRDEIAIDDVDVYQSQQCPQDPYFINPTTTPPTTNSVNCDFENTNDALCSWTQGIQDGFDWVLNSGPTEDYNSGPDVDHTLQTDQGHYMLVNSYEDIPRNTRAVLGSPLIAPSTNNRCFKLWYYMSGYNSDFLNVFILPYGYVLPMDPNLQIYGNSGPQWLQAQLTVPSSTRSFYIVVEGTVGDSVYAADIAVDDFSMTTGSCTATSDPLYPFVANCDFEDGMCGYTQPNEDYENDDEFDWFLNSGPTGTDGSGPNADHTKGTADGHYLYVEASQPRRPGDRARIISPPITYFNDSYCLQFFYHMSGDDTASLSVVHRGDYYPDEEIARLTGPDGNKWQPYNVDVSVKYGPVEIVFTGTVGNNYRGDIALDDIKFFPGSCGGFPATSFCNYEYGYEHCGYTQSTDDQLDWIWYDALAGETPPVDWPGYGSFVYVDGFNKTAGSKAVLQSETMSPTNNDHCFSFFYKLEKGMSISFIRVSQDGSRQQLLSYNQPAEMTYVEYNIPIAEHPNIYKVYFEATVEDNMTAGLAVLDNTFFVFGVCESGQPISDTTTTVAIILGILLGVAVIVLVAMGVLHYRKTAQKSDSYPAAMSYKNGGTNPTPVNPVDLTKDPGIDNPNYTTAPFSSA